MDKSKLPKSWKFDDRKYKIVWKKPRDTKEMKEAGMTIHGDCADPKSYAEERTIRFNPNLDTKDLFNLVIHECVHSMVFCLDEDKVTQIADELTDFIYACGFKIEKPD